MALICFQMSHHCFTKKPSESCEKSALILQIMFAATPKTVLLLHPISSAKGINPHNYLGVFQEYLWPQNAHCVAKPQEGVNLNSLLQPQSQSMLVTRKMLGEKTGVPMPYSTSLWHLGHQGPALQVLQNPLLANKEQEPIPRHPSNMRSAAAGLHKMVTAWTQTDFV